METSLPADGIARYVERLLVSRIPDDAVHGHDLRRQVSDALQRTEFCFSRIHRKYYNHGRKLIFDHLNADHMTSFLWFLGNTVWRATGDTELPTRLSYLNRMMHGLDLFYSVPMPDIFLLVHPIGTILGRAQYGDYLVVYQNCTVGADTDVYPRFGEGVILYSRSSVIGACHVGNNVVFAANSFVVNTDVADDRVVVGQYPNHKIIANGRSVRQRCFDPVAS